MKLCVNCNTIKPNPSFSKDIKRKDHLKPYCKSCIAVQEKSRYSPEKESHRKRKQLYNCSKEQYESLFLSQGGLCAICGSGASLCIDHCHKTGKIRGLLCRLCNGFLGKINDDINSLNKVKDYLTKDTSYEI